jgi:hypothetical protein
LADARNAAVPDGRARAAGAALNLCRWGLALLVFLGDSNALRDALDRNPEIAGDLLDGFAVQNAIMKFNSKGFHNASHDISGQRGLFISGHPNLQPARIRSNACAHEDRDGEAEGYTAERRRAACAAVANRGTLAAVVVFGRSEVRGTTCALPLNEKWCSSGQPPVGLATSALARAHSPLGLPAVFLWGATSRSDPIRRLLVESGDVALWSGPARFVYHGRGTAEGRAPPIDRLGAN